MARNAESSIIFNLGCSDLAQRYSIVCTLQHDSDHCYDLGSHKSRLNVLNICLLAHNENYFIYFTKGVLSCTTIV